VNMKRLSRVFGWLLILAVMLPPNIPVRVVQGAGSGIAAIGVDPMTAQFHAPNTVQAPVLKWQRGGCYSSWCETSWYSSPAAADLDGDGSIEVIGAAYTLFVLNGLTGELKWSRPASGSGGRVWPGVGLADLEGDGDLEILTAHGGGYLRALDHLGNVLWTVHPVSEEFRSLALGDLDGNGDLEIVVGRAKLDRFNAWVYEHTGSLRSGWPQMSGSEGSAAGIYNDTIGLGDLDGDQMLELVIPSDTITIAAYEANGVQMPTNPLYHDHSGHDMDLWAEVPAYIDLAYETRGWGPCYEEFTPRANFAIGPANVVDLNQDGVKEVVAIGNVHNCHTSPYTDLYHTPYILNTDRTRFNTGGFNWITPPINTGAPLSMNYNVIENIAPNPVTVDLDNDGISEVLFPSYDGKIHAFWLDQDEHANWPYSVYSPAEGFYRFPSEPVVADLDGNGSTEVIFASWTQKGSNRNGKLHILDSQGNPLHSLDLPAGLGSWNWNGSLAAPTLANLDGDADLELVVNTAHSGLVAYDLPGTENARILWGTGRGSYLRNGSVARGSLSGSQAQVDPILPGANQVITYTITLRNPGPDLPGAVVTATLPGELTYLDDVWASSGMPDDTGGLITWSGEVPEAMPVVIRFHALTPSGVVDPLALALNVEIDDGLGGAYPRQVVVIVNGIPLFLPLVQR